MEDLYSDALKEAYVNVSSNVILDTLELQHSAWTSPVRIVNDNADLSGLIEATADYNPGSIVTFTKCSFDVMPPESTDSIPEIGIRITNVGREISREIESASGVRQPIYVVFRQYLEDDASTTGPHFVLGGLSIRRVSCTEIAVTATAVFGDYTNRAFPNKNFTIAEFAGLLR